MQVEAYPNQIGAIIEALRELPPMALDILTFVILDHLSSRHDIRKVVKVPHPGCITTLHVCLLARLASDQALWGDPLTNSA